MTTKNEKVAIFLIAIAFCGRMVVNAQPAISISSDGSVSMAGQIKCDNISNDDIGAKSFSCKMVQQFKKGDIIPTTMSQDQSWSTLSCSLTVGSDQVQLPVLAMQTISSETLTLFPAVLTFTNEIKVGEIVHLDGYQIEAKRPVQAGESIPSLIIGEHTGYSIFSIEPVYRAKISDQTVPFLTILNDATKANDTATIIQAWRNEINHAGIKLTGTTPLTPAQISMAESKAKEIVRLVNVGDMDGAKKIVAGIDDGAIMQRVKDDVAKALKQ